MKIAWESKQYTHESLSKCCLSLLQPLFGAKTSDQCKVDCAYKLYPYVRVSIAPATPDCSKLCPPSTKPSTVEHYSSRHFVSSKNGPQSVVVPNNKAKAVWIV